MVMQSCFKLVVYLREAAMTFWSNLMRVFNGDSVSVPYDLIMKENPYHDAYGRFSSADTAGSGGMHNKEGVWHGADGKPVAQEIQDRLKAVNTPAPWLNVRVNDDPTADLQVKGFDSKGREQYRYSAEHGPKAAAEKFARLQEFNAVVPKVREAAIAQMNDDKLPFAKRDSAAALTLIAISGFRIGSDADTGAEKKAFGASNLLGSHVTVNGDTISFNFTGKKGVEQSHDVEHHDLALYIERRKLANGDGKLFDTNEGRVTKVFKDVAGSDFKVKDLRTWNGTVHALKAVADMPIPANKKEYLAARKSVGAIVARYLGNTPVVALSAYISPTVFHKWGTFHGK